ncbi:hypothetical protein MTR67_028406 [Solanum verrucosum]|uniref:Uncharacterized protein n=1 Tax=Solanum verrucosum TaxID=315347 RepID=A0AAF0RB54_SOLVR|nr:hypothetical protein MTR67_028406 [Solanum verrucosum]
MFVVVRIGTRQLKGAAY